MNRFHRRPAFSAALASCALRGAFSAPGRRRPASAEAARAISREHAALDLERPRADRAGEAMRPRARGDDEVTVASRERRSGSAPSWPRPPAAPRLRHARRDAARHAATPSGSASPRRSTSKSRGEPLEGQIAVAEVVLNRVDDRRFPKTVCGVTKQGAGSGRGCQFSYACDGLSDAMKSAVARERAEKLAALMLEGRART